MEKSIDKEGEPSKDRRADASDGEVETDEIPIGYEDDAPAPTTRSERFAAAVRQVTAESLGIEADEANEGGGDADSDYEIATQPPWSPMPSPPESTGEPDTTTLAQLLEGFPLPAATYSPVSSQEGNQPGATGTSAQAPESDFILPATTYSAASTQESDRLTATASSAQAPESTFTPPAATYSAVLRRRTDQPAGTATSAQAREHDFILPATTYSPASMQQGDQSSATGSPAQSVQSDFMLPAAAYTPVSQQPSAQLSAAAHSTQAQATETGFLLPATTYRPASNQPAQPDSNVGTSSNQSTHQLLPATTYVPASNASASSTQRAYQQLPPTTYVPPSNQQRPQAPASGYSSRAQAGDSGLILPPTTYTPASRQQQVQPAPARQHAPAAMVPGQEIEISRFPCISQEEAEKILANAYTAHALGPDFMLPRTTYSPPQQQQRQQPRASPATCQRPAQMQQQQVPMTSGIGHAQRSGHQLPSSDSCYAVSTTAYAPHDHRQQPAQTQRTAGSGYVPRASTYGAPVSRYQPAHALVNTAPLFPRNPHAEMQPARFVAAAQQQESSRSPVALGPRPAQSGGRMSAPSYAAAAESGLGSPAPMHAPAPSRAQGVQVPVIPGSPYLQGVYQQLQASTYVRSPLGQQMPQRPATASSFAAQEQGQHMPGTAYLPSAMQQPVPQYPGTGYSAPALLQQGYYDPGMTPSFSAQQQTGLQQPVTPHMAAAQMHQGDNLSPIASSYSPGQSGQQVPANTYRPFVLNDEGVPVPTTPQQYGAQQYSVQNHPGVAQSLQAENSPHGSKQPSKLSPTARSFCTKINTSFSLPVPGAQLPKSGPSTSTSKQSVTQRPPKTPASKSSSGTSTKSDAKAQGDRSSATTSQQPGTQRPAQPRISGPAAQQQTAAPHNPTVDPASTSDQREPRRRSHDLRINTATIEFTNVTYAYKHTDEGGALRRLSLKIEHGENVALVGLTGAGKSTLLKLLMGKTDKYAGSIKIDGVDIRGVTRESLEKQIASVPQTVEVLDASVLDNVRDGVEASCAKVVEVCRVVNLHDVIMGLDHGYGTLIGPGGKEVNRSMRAKLGIARLLLKDPKIVLLDACFRHLGKRAEYNIIRYLRQWCVGRTVITAAHRVGVVTLSDRIYVMTLGILVQSGTHIELIFEDGLYRKLWILKKIV